MNEACGRNAPPPNLDECLIRIRLHKSESAYVAHCLELDLVAVDEKPWRAVEKLTLLMNRQISFGIERGAEDRIWFPAPSAYEPPVPPSAPIVEVPDITDLKPPAFKTQEEIEREK